VSPALRFVRTLLTLWLTFILTQPVPVHACAMRNGTLRTAPATPTASGAISHAQHDMAAAMRTGDAAMGMTMDHAAQVPSDDANKGCHCIGDCAAAASVALLAPRYSAIPAPARVLAALPGSIPIVRSFDAPTYLHPPATAPPIA